MYRPTPSIKLINKKKKNFIGISLFAGCGGSSTGHKLGGVDIKYANEFIPAAQETYKLNHPKAIVDGRDIRLVKASDILKKLGIKKGDLDLFDASPPCKSFSVAGAKSDGWGKESHYSDGVHQRTDDLFDVTIELLKGIMPKVFTFENVPGLVHGKAKGYFVEILNKLIACGYKVEARIVDAAYLGVPQARRRLIFVGVRNDLVKLGFNPVFPKPKPYTLAVRDVLPNIHYIKTKVDGIPTYVVADRPSPTITASDAETTETALFSCGGFVETNKGVRRKYKIEELKVIGSFPSDYEFFGTYEQQFERIGRAVPPVMMYHITSNIVKSILEPYSERKTKKG